jgi:uncharacterized protein
MRMLKDMSPKNVLFRKGFWKSRVDMVTEKLIPYQWKALNNRIPGAPPSFAVENFRIAAGESEGKPKGTIFQDSDVAKWIETAAYSLMIRSNPELEQIIDELVRLIEKSQLSDGYVNTFFIAGNPEKRWTDMNMGHELYCAGHMMEAAVAYYEATGKRRMLDIMCRYADHINEVFGPGENQNHSYDGHPEIELALHRLAKVTGEQRYTRLADYFLGVRGSVEDFYTGKATQSGMMHDSRWFFNDYYLAHKPVEEMNQAEGHAVRAMYLYSAMADMSRSKGGRKMLKALTSIWRNTVDEKMYITGGLGSQSHGERFTIDYDLPADTGFFETCASVGLVFWARRMFSAIQHGEYPDIIERALYNGALSGVSLDGTRYFYSNPLEVNPEVAAYRHDHEHIQISRVPWFDCACCPTNIARLIESLGTYMASCSENAAWIHQYTACEMNILLEQTSVRIKQDTEYPWDGKIRISLKMEGSLNFTLFLRIPGWCADFSLWINGEQQRKPLLENGYLVMSRTWQNGAQIELDLDMPVRFVRSNSNVREYAGKVAVQRGPVVYCAEEVDNGKGLQELVVDPTAKTILEHDNSLMEDTRIIYLTGYRDKAEGDALYFEYEADKDFVPCRIRTIPYYQWGNRGDGQEMRVWLRVKQ